MNADVLLAGHICIDLTPQLFGTPRLRPGELMEVGPARLTLGGSVANTGRALAAAGLATRAQAVVGDDDLGRLVIDLATREGMECSGIEVRSGVSTSYSLIVEPTDVDRSIWHHPGANELFDGCGVDPTQARVFHVGYPPLLPALLADDGRPLRAVLERARSAGTTTSLDMAVVDPGSPVAAADWPAFFAAVLPLIDVLSPSYDDIASALGSDEPADLERVERLARGLLADGAAVVALSAGALGLYLVTAGVDRLQGAGSLLAEQAALWADRAFWTAADPVAKVVTTNGAGDAATAGLLHGMITGAGPEASARRATRFAALSIAGRRPTPADGASS